MKASAFSYTRVSNVVAALELLAVHGTAAKILSGGQSLMPTMNLRLTSPALIIDIGAISELHGISVASGLLRIGALTRHVDLLKSPDIAMQAPLLSEAVAHIAHPSIRNKGTIGGNLAHADPAAELPACTLVLDAMIVVRSLNGERRIRAVDFFTGSYASALAPQELLTSIEIPVASTHSIHFFEEHARRKGGHAMAGLAASASLAGDTFAKLHLGFFGIGEMPLLAKAADHLTGKPVTAQMLADAQAALNAEINPPDDQQASAAMRRYLARQLLGRCVATMLGRPDLEARKSA
jgi:carbon-monoxide dehydrogenase medium subunit